MLLPPAWEPREGRAQIYLVCVPSFTQPGAWPSGALTICVLKGLNEIPAGTTLPPPSALIATQETLLALMSPAPGEADLYRKSTLGWWLLQAQGMMGVRHRAAV